MNTLVLKSQNQTMTSKEMADLTEKRHDNVQRTIETLAERGVISLPQFEEVSNAGPGPKTIRQYRVCKRDSFVIVAQLSPEFTARLVDRWQELENGISPAFQVPQSFAEALRLAAEQQEQIQQQAAQIAAAAPKVEFVDRYVESSSGSKGFRQVCKLLQVNEHEFRVFLHDAGIMYKLGGEWVPFAQHMDAGRFEVKAGTSEISGHAYNAAKFTAKGVQWVAGEWAKHKLEAQL